MDSYRISASRQLLPDEALVKRGAWKLSAVYIKDQKRRELAETGSQQSGHRKQEGLNQDTGPATVEQAAVTSQEKEDTTDNI